MGYSPGGRKEWDTTEQYTHTYGAKGMPTSESRTLLHGSGSSKHGSLSINVCTRTCSVALSLCF